MRITRFIIAALLPVSLWVSSCNDEDVDNTLGRTIEFPEMSEQERGKTNGEMFGNSLMAMCDTIKSARSKDLLNSPVFCGMLTSPLSKAQRPYELYKENQSDSLWMVGFNEGLQQTASVSKGTAAYSKVVELMEKIDFADIDKFDNSRYCLQIEESMSLK